MAKFEMNPANVTFEMVLTQKEAETLFRLLGHHIVGRPEGHRKILRDIADAMWESVQYIMDPEDNVPLPVKYLPENEINFNQCLDFD